MNKIDLQCGAYSSHTDGHPTTMKFSLLTEDFASRHSRQVIRTGFALVMLIVAFIILLGINQLSRVSTSLEHIIGNEQIAIEMLFRMQQTSRDRSVTLYRIASSSDAFERDEQLLRYDILGNQFGIAREKLISLALADEEQKLIKQQAVDVLATIDAQKKVISLTAQNKIDAALRVLNEQAIPEQDKILDSINSLLELEIAESHENTNRLQKQQRQTRYMMIIGGLLAAFFVILIARFVNQRMDKLITGLSNTAHALHLTNQRLEHIQQAVNKHNIVSIADVSGNITYVNDLFCQISQYSKSELMGHNHRILKSGMQPDKFFDELWRTISSGRIWQGEICNRNKQGGHYWVASTIVPMMDDAGLPSEFISIRTDITAIKDAQQVLMRSKDELEILVQHRTLQLQEHEALLNSITSAAQDAVIMTDHRGMVTFWNPAAETMFGYKTEEVLGQSLLQLIAPVSQHAHFIGLMQTNEKPRAGTTSEARAKRLDQSEFPVEISLSNVKFKNYWHTVAIMRDITTRKITEERLKQLATTDPLTNAYNRRYFNEKLQNELSRVQRYNTPLTFIILDIDNFKKVNDTFGHIVGDHVLIQLSALITTELRDSDVLARWGGEEFTILAPNCDPACGLQLAEKLRLMIEKTTFPDVGKLTCSFGVTSYHAADDPHSLIKRADDSLYLAKKAGRNRVECS